jgi:hypothetical protein
MHLLRVIVDHDCSGKDVTAKADKDNFWANKSLKQCQSKQQSAVRLDQQQQRKRPSSECIIQIRGIANPNTYVIGSEKVFPYVFSSMLPNDLTIWKWQAA